MGVLRHAPTGVRHTLPFRVVVGRSQSCGLRLSSPHASGEHAVLWWDESGWVVRDLASRNGTFVGDRRTPSGDRVELLEGDTLGFGVANEWVLVDATMPAALAREVGGPGEVVADGGILALPTPEHPDVSVYEGPFGGWVVERDGVVIPATDLAVIEAGGRSWQLHLPRAIAGTQTSYGPPSIDTVALEFGISRDQEYIEITLVGLDGTRTALDVRSHHSLLFALARARLEDADVAEPERGWVYGDVLARQLATDLSTLNVHVHRARQQLAQLGVVGAPGVVVRRPGTGQLRLGVERVVLGPL